MRRSDRLLTVVLLVVAVALQGLPAQASVATPHVGSSTPVVHAAPTFYCGPLLDKVCRVICPHCALHAATPAANTGSAASSKLMCARELQQVCAAVFTVPCTLRPNACPTGRQRVVAQTTSPRFMCAKEIEQACYVAGLVLCHFHNCYATPEAFAPRRATATMGRMYCDIDVICLILAETVCKKNPCY